MVNFSSFDLWLVKYDAIDSMKDSKLSADRWERGRGTNERLRAFRFVFLLLAMAHREHTVASIQAV